MTLTWPSESAERFAIWLTCLGVVMMTSTLVWILYPILYFAFPNIIRKWSCPANANGTTRFTPIVRQGNSFAALELFETAMSAELLNGLAFSLTSTIPHHCHLEQPR